MPYVLNEDGSILVEDGKPVFENSDGTRFGVDAEQFKAKIKELNQEQAANRIKLSKLKEFDGLDIDDVRDAFSKRDELSSLSQTATKKSDEIRRSLAEQHSSELKKLTASHAAEVSELNSQLSSIMLENAFANSQYVKTVLRDDIPPSAIRAAFGTSANFKTVKDSSGRLSLVGVDRRGETLFNNYNADPMTFDEALKFHVESHSEKNYWLRPVASGSGASGGVTSKKYPKMTLLEARQKIREHPEQRAEIMEAFHAQQ